MPKKAPKSEDVVTAPEIDKDADERRLFYVALTRAKDSVTISYARNDNGRELLPSIFLNEMKQDLIEKLDGNVWDEKYKNDVGFRFGGTPSLGDGARGWAGLGGTQSFVRDLFTHHGMSPTALNNYLSCPWKYFYQNLVRIPAVPNKHMMYGTAVHGALEDFFKHIKTEGESKTYLISAFENNLNKQKIDPRDRDDMYDKGVVALSGWFDEYTGTWNAPSQMETNIRGIQLQDGIKITGKLDRVEFVEDSLVNVIDYKTGKPKSRNELMGKTKGSTGDYYRQLVFYKLLLKYYKDGAWAFQTGILDFIEPDDRGNYRREVFEIPDEDVVELEQKIIDVSDEIINLKFWDKKCDDRDCEFCKLRDLMQ